MCASSIEPLRTCRERSDSSFGSPRVRMQLLQLLGNVCLDVIARGSQFFLCSWRMTRKSATDALCWSDISS